MLKRTSNLNFSHSNKHCVLFTLKVAIKVLDLNKRRMINDKFLKFYYNTMFHSFKKTRSSVV